MTTSTELIDLAQGSDSAAAWLLPVLRFASPTLPIGAYAYSRGLEYAVHAGWVHDEASSAQFLLGSLEHASCGLEGPIYARLHAAFACGVSAEVERWNGELLAQRESAELRLEDTQLGAALARLLAAQGVPDAQRWAARNDACYATLFARAMTHHHVPDEPALLAYLWALAESQVGALLRLVPLGQTAAQRLLARIASALPEWAEQARARQDAAIGALAPGLALASALHETQYTRLFRS